MRLVQEWLLVLDDLDRHVALILVVEGLHHLSEAALACKVEKDEQMKEDSVSSVLTYERVNFVAVEKLFTILNDVVVVFVIVAVVVELSLLLV